MANWYVNEGLVVFDRQWKEIHPNATIYHIADKFHSKDPDVTQHAPDDGGPQPGDNIGEVDAGDYMPGNGVTEEDLDELFFGLQKQRDPRIMYVIYRQMIFSSVVSPWKIRTYSGKFHEHVHLSLNDVFEHNDDPWRLDPMAGARYPLAVMKDAKLPEKLVYGNDDEDFKGWNHVGRMQALLNFMDNKIPDLDIDGVYGVNTVEKVKSAFKPVKVTGKIVTLEMLKKLHGIA